MHSQLIKAIEKDQFLKWNENTLISRDSLDLSLAQKTLFVHVLKKVLQDHKAGTTANFSIQDLKKNIRNTHLDKNQQLEDITGSLVGHCVEVVEIEKKSVTFFPLLSFVSYDHKKDLVSIKISEKFMDFLRKTYSFSELNPQKIAEFLL
jgi:hypothetical protein